MVATAMSQTNPTDAAPPAGAANDAAWPQLDEATLDELEAFGEVRAVERGDILYRAGEPTPDFFVVLEGEAEIVRIDDSGEMVVATHGAHRFLGELNLLTGQRAFLTRASRSPDASWSYPWPRSGS